MRVLLKIYTSNKKLYIENYLEENGDKNYYSQFGQDDFVLKKVFTNKTDGFFIDIGANHPIQGSNTYLLERNGWKGLAFEPQESLNKLWPINRKTPCLKCVIGPENKYVSFIEGKEEEHGLSGVEGFNKCSTDHRKVTVQQRKFSDIISEHGIKKIDYLSIDVEGYELNVLKSIDFSQADIKLISVENDLGFKNIPFIGKRLGSELGNNNLRKFIENEGYTYIARIMCDDFFIKK